MVQRIYNNFYGGIKQDNYLTGGASFIDSRNMDGIKQGEGMLIGPKSNKLFLSNEPIKGFVDRSSNLSGIWAVGGGEIYVGNGGDNTPIHTLTDTSFYLTDGFRLGSYYYFVGRFDPTLEQVQVKIARISVGDTAINNWAAMDEAWETGLSTDTTTPIQVQGTDAYLGTYQGVFVISGAGTKATYSFADNYLTGLTFEGTVMKAYSITGNMYSWIPGNSNYSTLKYLGERIDKVGNDGNFNYITCESGNLYQEAALSSNRLSRKVTSDRLEDNSSFQEKFNFATNTGNNITVDAGDGNIFIVEGNAIYKYGNLFNGLTKGFFKILDTSSQGAIDEIYTIYYHNRSNSLLYSYDSNGTYGVDYIDLNSRETSSDAYAVTEVFTGGTAFEKELNVVRLTVSNVDTDNYAKLYYRVNNGSWVLLRNITSTTDGIYYRENIYMDSNGDNFENFIDIQFKIELHSDDNDETPPTINELMFDYNVINA